jgi:hypothetical protein
MIGVRVEKEEAHGTSTKNRQAINETRAGEDVGSRTPKTEGKGQDEGFDRFGVPEAVRRGVIP